MTTSTAESTQSGDLEYLSTAAPFVFLLVAAADGKVDKKELKQFSKLLADERFAMLAGAMASAGTSIEQLLMAAQQRLKNPMVELLELRRVIDTHLSPAGAAQFKTALQSFGQAIAEASGGFFGFGRKVDKHEAAMLKVIGTTLGVDDAAADSQTTESASSPQDALTDELFPALKPAQWVTEARGHVAMRCIYSSDEVRDGDPVVGYVHDKPETVQFVPANVIGDEVSPEHLHEKAMENLETRLAAAVEWQELSFDPSDDRVGAISGLVLTGDYFAAEAILSPQQLKLAHEKLNSAMLMAITPQRGELFVTSLVSQEEPEPERVLFAQFAIKRFFNPEQAPIAPNVFIIRNGKIVGHIAGMDDIVESARRAAESEREQEESLLQHTARLTGNEQAVGLRIDVQARCIETMNKNLQHVIRAYVQQVVRDMNFRGAVEVFVTVEDPACDSAGHEHVGADLTNMAQFLNSQFAALGIKAADGTPVNVRCTVEGIAAG